MVSIPYLLALSINLLALLPTASPLPSSSVTPAHLLSPRSPAKSDYTEEELALIYDSTIHGLFIGAQKARAAIAKQFSKPPATSWLVVSYGNYRLPDKPSGFILVDLSSQNAIPNAPIIPYAHDLLQRRLVQLKRSLSASDVKGTAPLMEFGFLVEGWLSDEEAFEGVVNNFNAARIPHSQQPENVPGYIAYMQVMYALHRLPGYFDISVLPRL